MEKDPLRKIPEWCEACLHLINSINGGYCREKRILVEYRTVSPC